MVALLCHGATALLTTASMPEGRAGSFGRLLTVIRRTASQVSSGSRGAGGLSVTSDSGLASRIRKGPSSGDLKRMGQGPFLRGS